MKFIVAIIQPFKLDAVREGLSELGVEGLTASEVRGFGRQKGHREVYRGSEYTINYVPKVKIEIAVGDELAERVIGHCRREGTSLSIDRQPLLCNNRSSRQGTHSR